MSVPFRLGATSFIYPGGWLANAERLAPRFDDIEILFFEAAGDDDLPGAAECAGLLTLKQRSGITYSLHTPLAASLASPDEARRTASVALVRRALAGARFAPDCAVLHIYLGEMEHDPRPPTDLAAWRRQARRSLEAVIASGWRSVDLCIEVLDYDFALIAPVVEDLDLSIALDVGHLARDGGDEQALLCRHLDRTRIIQWHGTDPADRDHRSLRHYPRDRARRLVRTLIERDYRGVLTLEVFRADDLEESRAMVAQLLDEEAA